MKRIMILGSPGSGKSTLAIQLGEITGFDVLHLDTLYWQPGWIKAPSEEFEKGISNFVHKDTWIMDGNYRSTLDMRLELADTVIYIDKPRIQCICRAIKRRVVCKGKTRPDMTIGCDEKFDWTFFKWIWQFPSRNKKEIMVKIMNQAQEKQVYVLKTQQNIAYFIQHVEELNCQQNGLWPKKFEPIS